MQPEDFKKEWIMHDQKLKELPTRMKTIKVDIRVWDSLKKRKKENETFNDVIKDLLDQRTKSMGNKNVKAIKYKRRKVFFNSNECGENVGFEFEYNDAKDNKDDFILDLKIKKIFFRKKVLSPSEFFGVDNEHKHYSELFLLNYLKFVSLALAKEFRVQFDTKMHKQLMDLNEFYQNLSLWKQLYYEYNLSEESFKEDIEEPLRLSEEENPSGIWRKRINESISNRIGKEYKEPIPSKR